MCLVQVVVVVVAVLPMQGMPLAREALMAVLAREALMAVLMTARMPAASLIFTSTFVRP